MRLQATPPWPRLLRPNSCAMKVTEFIPINPAVLPISLNADVFG
jgi:hypothetical protein